VPGPLLLADTPWLLYRSFFALPKSIVGADGQPVNALLGTVNALLTVLQARPSRAVAACFGAEEATYRVELYPGYHAQRDPMPPELASQWGRAPALLESLGWTVCDAGDLEADDAMFSHARAEVAAGGEALLLTADRDLFQAVGERVAIVELAKGSVAGEIGPAQVRDRYHGIGPGLVPDLIALRGDPSDGMPGAPGVGVKTAAELLLRHETLEGVLAAATADDNDMRPRIAASLREHAELLRAFKEIATLVLIDVQRPPDRATDYAGGALAAGELGMRQLATRLERMAQR
jgi:5'-3' exonuclease